MLVKNWDGTEAIKVYVIELSLSSTLTTPDILDSKEEQNHQQNLEQEDHCWSYNENTVYTSLHGNN